MTCFFHLPVYHAFACPLYHFTETEFPYHTIDPLKLHESVVFSKVMNWAAITVNFRTF